MDRADIQMYKHKGQVQSTQAFRPYCIRRAEIGACVWNEEHEKHFSDRGVLYLLTRLSVFVSLFVWPPLSHSLPLSFCLPAVLHPHELCGSQRAIAAPSLVSVSAEAFKLTS